jgi:hypothetical protein
MMKPWQTPLTKAPSKVRGKRKEGTKREDPKSKSKDQNPKRVTKEHRNKSCPKAPTIARSISERKRNQKGINVEEPSLANNIMPQNKDDLSSLQSYLTPLQCC